jgi:hypothetical protein
MLSRCLAQINVTVGDFENVAKILACIDRRATSANLVASELAVTGCHPKTCYCAWFIHDNLNSLNEFAKENAGVTAIAFVDSEDDIYNAAAVVHDGALGRLPEAVFAQLRRVR